MSLTKPFMGDLRVLRVCLAAGRIAAFLGLIVLLTPFHLVMWGGVRSMVVARFFHRLCRFVFGIRVRVEGGENLAVRPAVFVCNHISYLDIIVLGSLADFVFVAKSDVADWPLFGVLARMQDTVFIRRTASGVDEARAQIAHRLAHGARVVVFPEGTSTDGRDVLPFKSALFSMFVAEEGGDAPAFSESVVPMCIRLAGMEGRMAADDCGGNGPRATYGWYGDMTLVPHLWRFAQSLGTHVVVLVAPPVRGSHFSGRKQMAQGTHRIVAGLLRDRAPHVPDAG